MVANSPHHEQASAIMKLMADSPLLRFPKSFLWGAATSAHQVEGGLRNNWTEWERVHASRLARGAAKAFDTPSVHWYRIKHEAVSPENYISGRGIDHYHRYEKDFDIAQDLRLNTYRFSIEWSRIEPKRGEFDMVALEHYRKMIQSLRRRGIEPMVTLWHFALPLWVEEQMGFQNPKTISDFGKYVRRVVEYLGEDVDWWCTINEPEVFATMSYWIGLWPPQQRNMFTAIGAYASILPRAHIKAYKIIKELYPQAKVGISKNMIWYTSQGKFVTPAIARLWNWFGNYYFLDQIKKHQDYIGLNYYFKYNLRGLKWDIDQQNPSDMGWGLHPEGMYALLKAMGHRYTQPLIITECGLADAQDESRAWYIKEVLRNVHRAMTEGVDVRGFVYWSLLDNFEWDKGYWPKFGLVEVDRTTMKRTVRPSAREYAKIIQAGGLD